MRLIQANQATAAKRRVYFHLVDATDGLTAETGENGGQPQISTDGAVWTNTGIGTLVAIGSGRYYAELAQTAVATAGAVIETRYKSANTAECPGDSVQVVAFNPDDADALGLSRLDTNVNSRSSHTAAQAGSEAAAAILVDPATDKIDGSAISETRLANLNAAISTRSSHTAADVRAEMDANSVDLDALLAYVDELETRLTAARAAVLDKLDSTLELDGVGPAYQFTAAALDQAPAGGSGTADWADGEREQIRQALGITGTTAATTGTGLIDLVKQKTDLIGSASLTAVSSIDALGNVECRRGDTLRFTLNDIAGLVGRGKVWFTVKRDRSLPDASATIGATEAGGLLVLNGAAYGTPAHVTLAVDQAAGTVTVTIDEAATALLPIRSGQYYDLQVLDSAGDVKTYEGRFDVVADVTRAVA